MAVNLSMLAGAGAQFFDNNGVILSGGLVYTYAAGTTTPQAAYTTSAGSIAHSNPIVLDSAGRVASGGEIWLTDAVAYKFVLKTATATTIGTYDNITGNASGIYAAFAASSGSSLVGFIQNGTGAVATTVQTKLRETVSVKDFGAKGDGTTDDTAAINLGISAALVLKQPLFFPAGTYLVTSTINIPVGTQLLGVKGDQYPAGFGVSPLATTINFQPSVASSDLFVASGTSYGGFRFFYAIEGFYFTSNSNARYGLNLTGVIYGRFENLAFNNTFTTGIYCNATINNRFVNIYTTGTFSAVLYAGNNETTDVWEHCSFFGATIGIDFAGSSIAIRFEHCLWEQMLSYGMRIAKECQSIQVIDGYVEDVPYSNTASASMFNVGYVGTTLIATEQLVVIGGNFSGRNAGTVGYFLDCNYCNGVQLIGVNHNRFTQIINTTANTALQSIRIHGGSGISWTTYANDFTRISGSYPNGVNNAGTPSLEARYLNVNTNTLTPADAGGSSISIAGGLIQLTAPSGAVYPNTNGTTNLGSSSNRWATVYAATGTINTSDEHQKQQIKPIDEAAIRAWEKINYCQFKFNDAVALKNSGARWHFGVIAQRVKEAFESEGLDAFSYGLLCYDVWPDKFDEEGKLITAAGNSFGIRYDEALILECAYLRSKLK